MNACAHALDRCPAQDKPAWGAVFSLSLGVFGLVTAEFLPASLLTPMAASLGVSEGLAGQAVTATAAVAMITSLLIATATRTVDRRHVLLAFSVLLIASNLLVAFAPDLLAVLLGRVLLGVAIGGFWTMSAATAMRLVPEALVPRALSIMFSGVSLATIAAAPLGSYFGHLIGWRRVFLLATALGGLGWSGSSPRCRAWRRAARRGCARWRRCSGGPASAAACSPARWCSPATSRSSPTCARSSKA